PLNGCRDRGCRASAIGRSTAFAPECSMLARVVSKWALLGTTLPLPPTSSNRSEERRVGKEGRSRGGPCHEKESSVAGECRMTWTRVLLLFFFKQKTAYEIGQ